LLYEGLRLFVGRELGCRSRTDDSISERAEIAPRRSANFLNLAEERKLRH
jgi:hypothetical protein